jgi:hypothetical protein
MDRQDVGTDDSCPQGSVSPLDHKVEVAVIEVAVSFTLLVHSEICCVSNCQI